MTVSYHHIAYAGFQVANPVEPAAVWRMAALTELEGPARAIDIGAGAGGVSVALARDLGLTVHAVERDPEMAAVVAARVFEAGVGDRVEVIAENSATALDRLPLVDLIVALGTTDAAAPGLREPAAIFASLAERLTTPGFILWGDLFWKGDPPAPLRQMIGLTGDYASDQGWREAAEAAGLTLVAVEITPQDRWDAFFDGADARVRDWLAAHAGHPDAGGIRTRADTVKAMFGFGRPYLGFGLYLLRKG